MTSVLDPSQYLTSDERQGLPPNHRRVWTVITAIEVIAASAAVLLDLIVPTLVLLVMALVSLGVRRKGFSSLGFHRPQDRHLVVKMLGFAALWSVFQLAVTMPIANRLSGETTDLSAYKDVQGNVALLLGWIALSWTLAALLEETAYRGYLQTRMRELFGSGRAAVLAAVLLSSVLFGVAHSEQGAVGVVTITLDAIAFSVVRYRFRTVWASVLAHGFNNTIGFVAFFLVGPIHGLW
jgi:membrane protease YdiL (CAAX protease family)